jgi:hypothetical protein
MSNAVMGRTVADKLALNSYSDGDCVRWARAHTTKGYGHLVVDGQRKYVHRLSYEVHIGPIPDGLELDHVVAKGCRFRDCIRPDHHEPVTHADNTRRRTGATEQHCGRGHAWVPESTTMRGRKRECQRCRTEAGPCPRCGSVLTRRNMVRHQRRSRCAALGGGGDP